MAPLVLFVASRVTLVALSALVLAINPVLERPGGSVALHAIPALDGLCRWDCAFIEQLTLHGYDRAAMTNFFPLLPMLARALTWLGIPAHLAILVVPNLAALIGYLAIYRVFFRFSGAQAATWGLAAFVAFPFSFFHATGYPESLMFCATALSLWFALEHRHGLAAFALGVGTLSRHLALLAGPALVVAHLEERGLRGFLRPRVLWLGLPLVIFGGYLGWQYVVFGDALAFLHARESWPSDAWYGVVDLFTRPDIAYQRVGWAWYSLVPTLAAVWLVRRKDCAVLSTYVVIYLVITWAVGLAGLGRYTASCWPAFLPLGVALDRFPLLRAPLLILFAAGQGLYFTLFVHQYPIL